ncbi:NAD(P)-binding protein [Leucogyrophana mollusca]|uniref:NAD(P)-binding protein n=1 Tax=Leucogyrophana mollusca TaxID=85980 RepID=A0ACB8BI64_9AGAM|nr:NAD(P)-binding protein [Leucogyrophana mollusca]
MGRISVTRFFREQWVQIPPPTTSAKGKSILVIGANSGLGLEASKQLASLAPQRLLLTCRNTDKGEEARKTVAQDSPGDTEITSYPLDLSSFESVRSFADTLVTVGDGKIDCILGNAAIATRKFVKTVNDWESTLQVNYLSHALLSLLLLPSLVKASTSDSASRLVLVSSDAHYQIKSLDDVKKVPNILAHLNDQKYCTASVMKQRYMISKLLVVIFVRELSARLPSPTPVAVSAVNPGFCHSSLTRESESQFPLKWMIYAFKAAFARTSDMGSRTLVHALTDPEERAFHGHYVTNCEVVEESDLLLGEDGKRLSERIWNETVEVLQLVDPRVKQIISEYLTA